MSYNLCSGMPTKNAYCYCDRVTVKRVTRSFLILEYVYSVHTFYHTTISLSVCILSLPLYCRAHVQSALGHRCRPIAAIAAAAAG